MLGLMEIPSYNSLILHKNTEKLSYFYCELRYLHDFQCWSHLKYLKPTLDWHVGRLSARRLQLSIILRQQEETEPTNQSLIRTTRVQTMTNQWPRSAPNLDILGCKMKPFKILVWAGLGILNFTFLTLQGWRF